MKPTEFVEHYNAKLKAEINSWRLVYDICDQYYFFVKINGGIPKSQPFDIISEGEFRYKIENME